MQSQSGRVTATRIDRCRVCGNTELIPCIDIGDQYLSSVFPTDLEYRKNVERYPLDMVLCRKKEDGSSCGLLQLGHRLDLRSMYDAYPYTSSTNSSMAKILQDVADSGRALNNLVPGDVVLDIGGNDGTLLSFFKDIPGTLISIDPAQNIKPLFTAPNYIAVRDFFSESSYASISRKKAKLIFSIAMFYHLDDPMKLVRDVAACLADDGAWVIQMAYLPAMLRTNMYDNIVHEHAGYYATHHMAWIMEQAGLEVFDVMENDVYGGSFRVFVKKRGAQCFPTTQRYLDNLSKELKEGLFDPLAYQDFMRRIEKTRDDLRTLLTKLKQEGKTVWIYGASTKGNTILQYCGLGSAEIVAAADSNPFKHGKYIIGADIPIKDEAEMRKAKPDYLLALPYSFIDGFIKREAALVSGGTRFIVPLPEVRIL
jgi:NDP-4-keto-2,6-dideoxyhexose 3-C-methyltransferase